MECFVTECSWWYLIVNGMWQIWWWAGLENTVGHGGSFEVARKKEVATIADVTIVFSHSSNSITSTFCTIISDLLWICCTTCCTICRTENTQQTEVMEFVLKLCVTNRPIVADSWGGRIRARITVVWNLFGWRSCAISDNSGRLGCLLGLRYDFRLYHKAAGLKKTYKKA